MLKLIIMGDEGISKKAVLYTSFYGGKVSITPKVPIRSLEDFAFWYTPGVAEVSKKVKENTELSFEYTNRWNTIGILTDGSRVLGLGSIGPEASLPVMEGKALIYKLLGGVDAFPLPIRVKNEEEFIETVKRLEPALGGINLEDIESPKCFKILESLKKELSIPVWHDDQQGTAGVVLAALLNALELTDRKISDARIIMLGTGAANIATARLLIQAGAKAGNIVMIDSKGILHPEREDMDQLLLRNKWKYELALITNGERIKGGLSDAIKGADVLIAASTPGPGIVKKSDISAMNKRSIVFLLANPVPEMWPSEAAEAGAEVIATGRSDFPNQVNNSLLFPGVFRGALDVRAKTISDGMIIAAANELAKFAKEKGLSSKQIIPNMLDWRVYVNVAAAVGCKAQEEGYARKNLSREELISRAETIISYARNTLATLMDRGIIASPPE